MSNKTANGFTLNPKWGGIFGVDIATPLGRLAFVNLDKPTGQNGQTPKYGVAFLMPKGEGLHTKSYEEQKKHLVAMQEQAKLMIQDLWGARAAEMVKKMKRGIFVDGDVASSTGKVYEGYPGNWVINPRNAEPNGHSRGWKILNDGMSPEMFESGMICRLTVQPYLGVDGFSYSLRAIKLVHDDGVKFGGAPDPSGVIDNLDEAIQAVNAAGSDTDFAVL